MIDILFRDTTRHLSLVIAVVVTETDGVWGRFYLYWVSVDGKRCIL